MKTFYLTLIYLLFIILIYQERKKLKRMALIFLKDKKGWAILLLATLIALTLFDGRLSLPKSELLADIGEKIGNGEYLIPLLTALTYSSYILNLNKVGDALREALISGALSGIIADVIKVGTARGRPRVSERLSWFNYDKGLDSDYWSFPSGHVALAAGAFLSLYLRVRGPVKALFLIPPLLTALSRVMTFSHWPSDVIASLILGFLIAKGGRKQCGR